MPTIKTKKLLLLTPLMLLVLAFIPAAVQAAKPTVLDRACAKGVSKAQCNKASTSTAPKPKTNDGKTCGNLPDDGDNVHTKINFGCLGSDAPPGTGPIQDMLFAIIRFASIGVGIAVVVAITLAGIQYSMAEGSPEKSQKAKTRVLNATIGLLIYIFAFSLLQFLIPGGIFS